MAQREVFISALFDKAKSDKDIYILSVDMGAVSLDIWRDELPDQFIAMGISEQNAINVAAGLSAAGKKVYVYFMACWVARCFEQIRYSCTMAKNPITILGSGPALGYSPAGPAHSSVEDLAYMRSLAGIEIYSPANDKIAQKLVDLTISDSKLRYIRLERSYPEVMDKIYSELQIDNGLLSRGSQLIKEISIELNKDLCIVSSGYMLGRAFEVAEKLELQGLGVSIIDLFKINSIDEKYLLEKINNHDAIVTIEEQFLSGGLGSFVCEILADSRIQKEILRIGLPNKYLFGNGSRDHLLDSNNLSVNDIFSLIMSFISKKTHKSKELIY